MDRRRCPRCNAPLPHAEPHDTLDCAVEVVTAYLERNLREDLAMEVACATDRTPPEERTELTDAIREWALSGRGLQS